MTVQYSNSQFYRILNHTYFVIMYYFGMLMEVKNNIHTLFCEV